MKELTFKVGEEVRLKGEKETRYRYVKNNVVRNIATGRCKGVCPKDIKPLEKDLSMYVGVGSILASVAIGIGFIIYLIFLL